MVKKKWEVPAVGREAEHSEGHVTLRKHWDM